MDNDNAFLDLLSRLFTNIYLFVLVPLTLLATAIFLLGYLWGRLTEIGIDIAIKLRRGIASVFPFFVSMYLVTISDVYKEELDKLFPKDSYLSIFLMLLSGLVIGYLFIRWVASIQENKELQVILSCLVGSTIFFTFITGFIVSKNSFPILSFVYGVLFGVCIYIIGNGFEKLNVIRVPNILKRLVRRKKNEQ